MDHITTEEHDALFVTLLSPSYGVSPGLGNAGNPSYAGAAMPAKFNSGPSVAAR